MSEISVSIIMGSQSDLKVMSEAARVLEELGVSHEVTIVSAHRTPIRMVEFAQKAASRGIKVIIAGAGGAAHLPGMVASLTTLPVIGVPVKSSNSIDGWDSVLSILQMPSGVPVATVALDGARNAGILAAQMIGAFDKNIAQNKEIQSVSIELDNDHYQRALIRFNARKNVKLMNGDSGVLMGDIVKSIKGPALFWLDGHYSGVGTAQGESETPVSLELSTIFQSSVSGHVILIDDIRCFDGSHDYPHLDKLLALIRDDGRWQVEISADIMRLTPKERTL